MPPDESQALALWITIRAKPQDRQQRLRAQSQHSAHIKCIAQMQTKLWLGLCAPSLPESGSMSRTLRAKWLHLPACVSKIKGIRRKPVHSEMASLSKGSGPGRSHRASANSISPLHVCKAKMTTNSIGSCGALASLANKTSAGHLGNLQNKEPPSYTH